MTEKNIRPEDDSRPAEAEAHDAGTGTDEVPETEAHRPAATAPIEQPAE